MLIDTNPQLITRTQMARLQQITDNASRGALALLTLSFALLTALSMEDEAQAQYPSPVIIHTANYTVQLGESITIEYEIENDGYYSFFYNDVDEVQVKLRPVGIESVSTYGYAKIDRGEELIGDEMFRGYFRATYTLPTASPRYFPPGTLFEVTFVFMSDGENVREYDFHEPVEYLDEDRDWQRIVDDDLELIYYDIPTSAIESLHRDTSRHVARIKGVLGVTEHPPLRAVIFPNVGELTKFGPTISQSATDGTFFGGFAYSQYLLTIMASPSVPILTHELTHLLHDVAMGSPSTVRAPAWLTEGIATYLETGQRNHLPRNYRNHRSITRFRELSSVPGLRQDIGIFYRQSADFLGFLAEMQGDESIGRLLAELGDGARLDDALVSIYGGNLDELENVWRAQYGLAPVDVREPIRFEPRRDYPPTLVPIPTADRGGENRLGDSDANEARTLADRAEPAVLPTALSLTDRIRAQAATPSAPTPTAGGYVTSPGDAGFRANPTLVLVFFLLALGFGALFLRRMRS